MTDPAFFWGSDAEGSNLRWRVLVAQLQILAYEGGCEAGKKQHTPVEVKVHDHVSVLLTAHLVFV